MGKSAEFAVERNLLSFFQKHLTLTFDLYTIIKKVNTKDIVQEEIIHVPRSFR